MTSYTMKPIGVLKASFLDVYELSYSHGTIQKDKLFEREDSLYGAAYSHIYSDRSIAYMLPVSYSSDRAVTDHVFHIKMYKEKLSAESKDSIDAGYFLVRDISMLRETSAGRSFTVNIGKVSLRYTFDEKSDPSSDAVLRSLLVPSEIAEAIDVEGNEDAVMFADPLRRGYETKDFKRLFRQ